MSINSAFYLFVIFAAVFGVAMVMMHTLMPSKVQRRLQNLNVTPAESESGTDGAWIERIAKLSTPLAKLSTPKEGWNKSPLRTQFMNAGIRGEFAPVIFMGTQTFLMIAIPSVIWLGLTLWAVALSFNALAFVILFGAAVGFYLPKLVLSKMVMLRKREIFENLPNALDLLTICIEAGLVMDAGIAWVSQEMLLTSPALSEELHLVTLELRAGTGKEKALRNLATRTGVEEIDLLVAMLIQTERFGTSIADALRVHSEHLRVKRRQAAEEAAAKIALKLLFPLILCIFPALMLVLLGPAAIQIYHAILQPTAS